MVFTLLYFYTIDEETWQEAKRNIPSIWIEVSRDVDKFGENAKKQKKKSY